MSCLNQIGLFEDLQNENVLLSNILKVYVKSKVLYEVFDDKF